MSMNYELVKAAILTTLAANVNGGSPSAPRFSLEGYQRQSHAAEEVEGALRHVSVYYRGGTWPKEDSGWYSGPFTHEARFAVEILLSARATMDLTVIESPTASDAQRMAALAASTEAASRADALWDEVAGIVWGILMDPRNMQLGLTTPIISERWIASTTKAEVVRMGGFVVLSGSMDYTCRFPETAPGETGVTAHDIDHNLKVTTDQTGAVVDPAKAGDDVAVT